MSGGSGVARTTVNDTHTHRAQSRRVAGELDTSEPKYEHADVAESTEQEPNRKEPLFMRHPLTTHRQPSAGPHRFVSKCAEQIPFDGWQRKQTKARTANVNIAVHIWRVFEQFLLHDLRCVACK